MSPRIFTRGWVVPSLIALIAFLVVGVSASAAAPKTRIVTQYTHVDFATSGGFPTEPGSTLVTVGPLTAKLFRPDGTRTLRGMGIRRTTVIDSPAPFTYRMKGKGRSFYPQATHKVRYHVTVTLDPVELTVSFEGAGRVVKGTGKYRGTTGRFKLDFPTRPVETTGPVTDTIRGWIRTPHWN